MKQCKWCGESFNTDNKPKGWMANHSRWCSSNPKRKDYVNKLEQVRNNITDATRRKMKKGIIAAHKRGAYSHIEYGDSFKGKKHTPETIEIIRQKALNSNHRRLRKGMVEYKGILLDSSWELALAVRLDELKIEWERPSPIKWKDKDKHTHNYFPDFYLKEYDLYIDPKNPAAFIAQKEKIQILQETVPNLIFLRTLEDCKNFTP